jgi:hypothetical protein
LGARVAERVAVLPNENPSSNGMAVSRFSAQRSKVFYICPDGFASGFLPFGIFAACTPEGEVRFMQKRIDRGRPVKQPRKRSPGISATGDPTGLPYCSRMSPDFSTGLFSDVPSVLP